MPPTKPRRIRLADVARLAGVSLGSASRALSAPSSVRQETLAQVRAAAARLGYVPDAAARALAIGRTGCIGTVLPTINNPVFSDFVQALQRETRAAGHQLLIAAHEYDHEGEVAIVEGLLRRGVDGLVLVGTRHHADVYRRIEAAGIPLLLAWSVDESPPQACVGIHNRRAMRPVVQHLLGFGHRDFAVLSGDPVHNERAHGRLEGVIDTLAAGGIALPATHVLICPFSVAGGREGLRRAVALQPRPTAIVACTDQLAAGALAEARRLGIAVPAALSITGFDDVEFAALLEPALTTVRVPAGDIGRFAARRLLRAIDPPDASQPDDSHTVIDTELVVRGSTGPAPSGAAGRP